MSAFFEVTEKRRFNWKFVGGISMVLVTFAGISISIHRDKFDFKLSKLKQKYAVKDCNICEKTSLKLIVI